MRIGNNYSGARWAFSEHRRPVEHSTCARCDKPILNRGTGWLHHFEDGSQDHKPESIEQETPGSSVNLCPSCHSPMDDGDIVCGYCADQAAGLV